MTKTIRGFTIVELLVVVAIMGILTTIGIVSFSRVQSDSRDSQRSSRITVIAEALEKYYDENGEYPSCNAMTQSPATVTANTLKGIDPEVLATPRASDGTNSILATCANLTSETDAFAYVGDGSSDCLSGEACSRYTLKYLEESTGRVISLTSRRSPPIIPPAIPDNLIATTVSKSEIGVSWDAVVDAATYTLQRDASASFLSPTTTEQVDTAYSSIGLTPNTTYYYRVKATNENGISGWSSTANATTNFDAPAAPTVTANTVAATTTWSWDTPSCPSGATARYQYLYTITPSGFDSGWTAIASSPIAFTTSTGGQTYTLQVQAQCYNVNSTSEWSASGSAEYYRASQIVKVLIVGGGGGGGGAGGAYSGGGGGAGGLIYNASYTIVSGLGVTVTVGNGGSADTNGSNSTLEALTAIGGGKGGSTGVAAGTGGSGGGGAGDGSAIGSGTSGQGYDGVIKTAARSAGGGGGNTTTGNGTTGGTGGNYSAIFGTTIGINGILAGGGGAGASGAGGSGGGGAGAAVGSATGGAGTANTGGGGGGGGGNTTSSSVCDVYAGTVCDGAGRQSVQPYGAIPCSPCSNRIDACRYCGANGYIGKDFSTGGEWDWCGCAYAYGDPGYTSRCCHAVYTCRTVYTDVSAAGGTGGSGVIVISYPTASATGTGGTITTFGSDTVHKFTSSGTFVIQ